MTDQLDWLRESYRKRQNGHEDASRHLRKLSRYAAEAVSREIGMLADTGLPFSADDVRKRLPDAIQQSITIAAASYGALFSAASRSGRIECVGTVLAKGRDRRAGRNLLWRGKHR